MLSSIRLLLICLFAYLLILVPAAQASTIRTGQVTATAQVGQYSLSLSGIIAPYASVILWQGDVALRTTVADENGQFVFTDVAINSQSPQFCLQAIDVKRLGDSYTCLNTPPIVNGMASESGIFLPPTFGLVAAQINVGETAIIWGYSMPGAQVTVYIGGTPITVTADSSGFYEIKTQMNTSGSFQLFADASYQSQKSLRPDKDKTLQVAGLPQIVVNTGKTLWEKIIAFLTNGPWGILSLALPLIILIFILIAKLKPEWFTWVTTFKDWLRSRLLLFSRDLHHAWFVGY